MRQTYLGFKCKSINEDTVYVQANWVMKMKVKQRECRLTECEIMLCAWLAGRDGSGGLFVLPQTKLFLKASNRLICLLASSRSSLAAVCSVCFESKASTSLPGKQKTSGTRLNDYMRWAVAKAKLWLPYSKKMFLVYIDANGQMNDIWRDAAR